MANPFYPLTGNLLISKFETDLKTEKEYFSRGWFRYVDDIFAVFDIRKSNFQDSFKSKNI